MTRRLSLFIVILFLLTSVVGAFHHHDDATAHHDCSICVTSHHHAASVYTAPSIACSEIATRTVYFIPELAIASKSCFTPANNRAPPA